MKIYLDFETRSEADLKRCGAWKYSLDPNTEILCLAYAIADLPTVSIDLTKDQPLYELNQLITRNRNHIIIEAHNAFFEFAVWHNILVPRWGFSKIPTEQWRCSAAKAAYYGLPRSLEEAAKAMRLPIEKDMAGRALMLKLCKPRPQWVKKKKGNKYFGDWNSFTRLADYCRQDVETERSLSLALPNLPELEQRIWFLDQEINRRGIACDLPFIKTAIELTSNESEIANEKIRELTKGSINTTGQVGAIKDYVNQNYNLNMPGLGAEVIDEYLTREIPKGAKQILQLRKDNSQSSIKKYDAMLDRQVDGIINETILYHGAHTGRWTGLGIQPQNYVRPAFKRKEVENLIIPLTLEQNTADLNLLFGSVNSALSSALRSSLIARPGYDLIGADYSAIEARVLLWLVGDENALNLLRQGKDLYIDMAAAIYKRSPESIGKKSLERQLGKIAILGLGYQMGPDRFIESCKNYGITIEPGLAEEIVRTYRSKYRLVVKYWKKIETAAKMALSLGHTTVSSPYAPLQWTYCNQTKFLSIQLPSGRSLWYKEPKYTINKFDFKSLSYMGVHPVSKKWVRLETYGGKFTENVVQAISRDIMAIAMLRCKSKGYFPLLTIHDEIVSEVQEGFGSIKEYVKLLCEKKDWMSGCPIGADGWKGKRYRK